MVIVSARLILELSDYCLQQYPNEACGVLYGITTSFEKRPVTATSTNTKITTFIPLKNISKQPTKQFIMNPDEWIRCLYQPSSEKGNLVGVFHSHPSETCAPSHQDRIQSYWNFATYWIISFDNNKKPILKAYKPGTLDPWVEQAIEIKHDDLIENINPPVS